MSQIALTYPYMLFELTQVKEVVAARLRVFDDGISANAYILAKDVHHDISTKEWPGVIDFVEDLAINLVSAASASRVPPPPPPKFLLLSLCEMKIKYMPSTPAPMAYKSCAMYARPKD